MPAPMIFPMSIEHGSNDAWWTLADEAPQPEDLLRVLYAEEIFDRGLRAAGADQHFDCPSRCDTARWTNYT